MSAREDMELETSVVVGDAKCESDNQTITIYDSPPKVRKAYTITKQREKWTEEEHQKFLEALKLYGRGWRQIEEHVGTKSAVQIRSHAQKLFSKVVRGSTGSVESSTKPIEIPPPRPKRKPVHPYPRKLAESLNITPVSNQPQRSPSPNFWAADKGTESPTSVLSRQGSDALGSAASGRHNRSPWSASCTSDTQSIGQSPTEIENDYMIVNSSDEGRRSLPAKLSSSSSTLENLLSMKFELGAKDASYAKEEEEASASFKLFGRTVLLSGFQKDSPSGAKNSQTSKTDEGLFLTLSSDQLNTNLSLGGAVSVWNRLEQPKESSNAETAFNSPVIWSTLYQFQLHYLAACNQTLERTPRNSCLEFREEDKDIPKERSCTDSNDGSASGVGTIGEKKN